MPKWDTFYYVKKLQSSKALQLLTKVTVCIKKSFWHYKQGMFGSIVVNYYLQDDTCRVDSL